jgi:hypothetical protein
MSEQVTEEVAAQAESVPQALKRGYLFNDLTARLKSWPSRFLSQTGVFPQAVKSYLEGKSPVILSIL